MYWIERIIFGREYSCFFNILKISFFTRRFPPNNNSSSMAPKVKCFTSFPICCRCSSKIVCFIFLDRFFSVGRSASDLFGYNRTIYDGIDKAWNAEVADLWRMKREKC